MNARPRWFLFLRQTALPLTVLLVGLALGVAVGLWLHQSTQQQAQQRFDAATQRTADEVQRRYTASVTTLLAARGLFTASGHVAREEFAAYARSRGAQFDPHGVHGLGYIERVSRADAARFIARQHADNAPFFDIKSIQSTALDPMYVVKYLEPGGDFHPSMGLDLGSERNRREAIERSVTFGGIALTPPISAANETVLQQMLMLPMYSDWRHPPVDDAQRNARFTGMVYTALVPSEMLRDLPDVVTGTVSVQVLDTTDGVSHLLFDSDLVNPELEFEAPSLTQHVFSTSRVVTVGGRNLLVQIVSTPAFEGSITRYTPMMATGAVCVLAVLLAALLRMQALSLVRAQRTAQAMTVELNRLAEVVKHTSNAVSISDRQGRIYWINEGFTRLSGYSSEEACGKTLGELVGSGKGDPQALATLAHAAAHGQACRVEILNRAKSGSEYWVDTELQPQFGADGALQGFMEVATDVTAQHTIRAQLEASLRENNALISALNSHAIVSVADREGRIQHVNDAFCSVSGYSREELIGHNHRIVNSGHHSAEFWSNLWKSIASGQPWRGEVCNRAKDGNLYWVDTFIAPSLGADGLVEHYIAIRINITASKQAAQEVERQRQALDNIISATNVGTWSWDYASGRVDINARWAQILGYHPDELRPVTIRSFNRLVHPDDLPQIEGRVEMHLQGGAEFFEHDMRMAHKDGHWVWVTTHGRVVERDADGAPLTIAGTHTDISERHAIEEESRRNAALLRGAIDAIGEAFVLFDPQDRMVLCNDKYRQTYPLAAPVMQPGVSFETIVRYGAERGEYAASVGRTEEWIAERMAQHRTSNSTLVQRLSNGKTLRIVERRLPDGHTVGFRIDITDLIQAQYAAEEASRAKSQFLANMSHEIRTPMNAILGMLTLLGKTALDKKQLDYTEKAQSAAKALLGLLNDILDISKVEAGKMTLDPQPFSVQQLLRDLSTILSANIGTKPVRLQWKVDPAIAPHLVGDALRLQQVLVNLGGNAVKFTEAGEVVIGLQLVQRTPDAVTIRFSVRDTGIGIAPENQAKIFSGFTQAEASTTRRFGGTGLGVSISHKLVALMGGELELHSELGKGSEFFFQITLPVSVARFVPHSITRRHSNEAKSSGARLEGLRILLAEDNVNNQQVACELLRDEGAVIDIANNGQEAVDILHSKPHGFDVVLMDLQMPVMDGLTATRMIRDQLGQTYLPIVAMTANAMHSDREACLQAGMNDHVGKPFDLDQLVQVLRVRTGRDSGVDKALPRLRDQRIPVPETATQLARNLGVELDAALARMGHKLPVYTSLLGTFLADAESMARELGELHARNDRPAAQRLLHTLKGLAATMGLSALSAQAAAAERVLKGPGDDSIVFTAPLVQETQAIILDARTRLLPLLEALRQEKQAGQTGQGASTGDADALRQVLQTLSAQLAQSDMQALETMAQLESLWPLQQADKLAKLQEEMAQLSFDTAQRECQRLLENLPSR